LSINFVHNEIKLSVELSHHQAVAGQVCKNTLKSDYEVIELTLKTTASLNEAYTTAEFMPHDVSQ
jgi:hypothetical protein